MFDVGNASHCIAYCLSRGSPVPGDDEQLRGNGLDEAPVKRVDQGKRRDDLRVLGGQSAPIPGQPAGEVRVINTEVAQQPIKAFLNAECRFCSQCDLPVSQLHPLPWQSHSHDTQTGSRQLTGMPPPGMFYLKSISA